MTVAPAFPKMRIDVRPASDGYPLRYRHWTPEGAPRGWMLTLHGIQSHSGWYESSGTEFARAGWDVRVPDRRGSGLNPLQRGHTDHQERLVHDVHHFLRDIHRERNRSGDNAPVILSGISWGGKLAAAVASHSPELLDGLCLITPGIFSKITPSYWDRGRLALARVLDIRDRLIPIPLNDPELFTSLPEKQEFIRNDPLALREMTLSFLYSSMDLDQMVQQAREISVPVLLMLAERDRIIDNQRTRSLMERLCKRELNVRTYSSVEHTLELDRCRDEFLHDWKNWAETSRSM